MFTGPILAGIPTAAGVMLRRAIPALCAVLTACKDSTPIRIGVVLDGQGVGGAEIAARDINAAGGIRGRPLELRIIAGQSGKVARVALAAAESLASDPTILAVVGHNNSAASLAGAQIYNTRRVVQIAPNSTSPVYSDAGPYSFRLVASDEHQGTFLAREIAHDPSTRRVAVMYVSDDYGRAINQTLLRGLSTHGITPVYEAPYLEGQRFTTDLEVVIGAIARSRPDLLVWLGREPDLRVLLPALRRRVPSIRVLASDGFGAARRNENGTEALVGVRYVRVQDPETNSPKISRIRERYRIPNEYELTDQFLLGYQCIELLAHAVKTVGANRERIRDFLNELGSTQPAFQGTLGSISFDANGDAPPTYYLMEVTPSGSRSVATSMRSNPSS